MPRDRSWAGFERLLWGGAAEPSQGSQGPASTPFQVGLEWLKAALQAQGDAPSDVDFNRLLVAGDALQSGWPFAEYFEPIKVAGPAAAAATFVITASNTMVDVNVAGTTFPAQPDLLRMVGLQVSHVGGAGAGTVILGLQRSVGTGGIGAGIGAVSIAVGGTAFLKDFANANVVAAPAPYAFVVFLPATAGGETYTVQAVLHRVPAGFRP